MAVGVDAIQQIQTITNGRPVVVTGYPYVLSTAAWRELHGMSFLKKPIMDHLVLSVLTNPDSHQKRLTQQPAAQQSKTVTSGLPPLTATAIVAKSKASAVKPVNLFDGKKVRILKKVWI
jgi:hypothetical protein